MHTYFVYEESDIIGKSVAVHRASAAQLEYRVLDLTLTVFTDDTFEIFDASVKRTRYRIVFLSLRDI